MPPPRKTKKQGILKRKDVMSYREHLAKAVERGAYTKEDVKWITNKRYLTLSKYDYI